MNWDKYKPYFNPKELTCKCGCGLLLANEAHLDMLFNARLIADIPFVIQSGTRCPVHNINEGGASNSDHLTGEGTDIRCLASTTRMKIFKALIAAGFNRIGIAKTFIHAGSNKNNPQDVLFPY